MNNKQAKKIRKFFNLSDPIEKRNYRRMKKKFKEIPHFAKSDFLDLCAISFNAQEMRADQ